MIPEKFPFVLHLFLNVPDITIFVKYASSSIFFFQKEGIVGVQRFLPKFMKYGFTVMGRVLKRKGQQRFIGELCRI